ncbi:MAG: thymidine phosphorylase [Ruminococcaceae bacterium]|nr:thymidine phosphorylase [Oscillospiraceae bacterium]
MRMYDIIAKKKHGCVLSDEEIKFFIDGYTSGSIPDYQASALCMAICFKGMTDEEAAQLTFHMMHSGDTVDLSALPNTADKHSTGGVGDKTSLIIAPTAAVLGLSVAKMSGRGLGHTGGTIDKLESIPGFRTTLTSEEFMSQVKNIGVAIIAQSGNLAPADKKLYSLRDVTATVDSLPLIASSIMSKKLASGAETIVLDVKYGSGAFMKTPEDATHLAEVMVNIGKANGRKMCALITDMDKPLGKNIGNSLEIIEAVEVLRGESKGELYDVCVALISNMLSISTGISYAEAEEKTKDAIDSGRSYKKFLEWISAQGGDVSYITENKLPVGKFNDVVAADCSGYIAHLDAECIGSAACALGAGRVTKDDSPDLSAGIIIEKNVGDYVQKGETLATLYTSDSTKLESAKKAILSCIKYSDKQPESNPIIYKTVY